MATKKLYRLLNLQNGNISLYDWEMSGCVVLDVIDVQYEDVMREEHRELILDGIEKRKEQLAAELVILEQRKQELLCIEHKPAPQAPTPEWEDYEPEEGK